MDETTDKKQPVDLTREQLHALVWSTSMSQLGQRFGISGNGLKKICDRLEVPYPSLGYWAKKAAGHGVPTKPLPRAGTRTPETVTITPTLPPSPPPSMPPEVQQQIDQIEKELGRTLASDAIAKLHPLVAAWIKDIERKQKKSKPGDYDYPGETTDMHRRQFRILDGIFSALARRQVKIEHRRGNQFSLQLGEETIELTMRERQGKTIGASRGETRHHAFPGEWPARDDMAGTGKLVFMIKRYLPRSLRTEWVDSDDAPLETLVPKIAGTLMAAFPLLAKQTEERREAERQRRLEEQKRYQEQQRRKLEDNRWRRFVEIARHWQDVQAARQLVEALRARDDVPGETMLGERTVAEWLAWTESQLSAHDPLEWGPDDVYARINAVTTWTYRD